MYDDMTEIANRPWGLTIYVHAGIILCILNNELSRNCYIEKQVRYNNAIDWRSICVFRVHL